MMQSKSFQVNFGVVTIAILFAVFSRLLPHPPNFAPMLAIGIFGGALFMKKIWAWAVPVIAIWLSDLFLNNVIFADYFDSFVWLYDGWYWQYVVYFLVPAVSGFLFKRNISIGKIAGVSIGAALLFFLISNFGVWASTAMYPKTTEGLYTCYIMGLPFLKGTLLSNLCYSTVLFGGYYIFETKTSFIPLVDKYRWRWI